MTISMLSRTVQLKAMHADRYQRCIEKADFTHPRMSDGDEHPHSLRRPHGSQSKYAAMDEIHVHLSDANTNSNRSTNESQRLSSLSSRELSPLMPVRR